jgi:hypothetical protein
MPMRTAQRTFPPGPCLHAELDVARGAPAWARVREHRHHLVADGLYHPAAMLHG